MSLTKNTKESNNQAISITPPYPVCNPANSSANIPPVTYSQAISTRCETDVSSLFHGTTIIHGGTFNFFGHGGEKPKSESPVKKYRRILPLESSSSDSE